MIRLSISTLVIIVSAMFSFTAFGQTCCTAGMPVGSVLGIASDTSSFVLNLRYEYKSINLLVDNNSRLENDPRSRSGQNISLKFDYGLSKAWAFSVIVPFIQQRRQTVSESQRSFGLGDAILLTQYSLNRLSLGTGVKLPTGKLSHSADSGLLLSPDMQSGSGSVDYLFRAGFSFPELFVPFLVGNLYSSYRINGVNDDFGSSATFPGRRFGFGNEYIAGFDLDYTLIGNAGFFIPHLGLQFRNTAPNIEQQVEAPNSGGSWLNLFAGLAFSPDSYKTISFFAEIPIYQNLEGLQITTDFGLGLQLSSKFIKTEI